MDTPPTISPQRTSLATKNQMEQPVTLTFWDTAGEEKFRAITDRYVRSADIVLLCFEMASVETDSKQCIDVWLKFINDITNSCEIWLVGTKQDQVDLACEDAVRNAVMIYQQQENVKGYYSTSAKTGAGVDDLVWVLANTQILRQPADYTIALTNRKRKAKCC